MLSLEKYATQMQDRFTTFMQRPSDRGSPRACPAVTATEMVLHCLFAFLFCIFMLIAFSYAGNPFNQETKCQASPGGWIYNGCAMRRDAQSLFSFGCGAWICSNVLGSSNTENSSGTDGSPPDRSEKIQLNAILF